MELTCIGRPRLKSLETSPCVFIPLETSLFITVCFIWITAVLDQGVRKKI